MFHMNDLFHTSVGLQNAENTGTPYALQQRLNIFEISALKGKLQCQS